MEYNTFVRNGTKFNFNSCWRNSVWKRRLYMISPTPSLDNMQSETHNRCCLSLAWHDIKLHYPSDVRIRTSRNMKQVGRYGLHLRDFSWTMKWFARSMHPRHARIPGDTLINFLEAGSSTECVKSSSLAVINSPRLYSGDRSLAYIAHWRHAEPDCSIWHWTDWLSFPNRRETMPRNAANRWRETERTHNEALKCYCTWFTYTSEPRWRDYVLR